MHLDLQVIGPNLANTGSLMEGKLAYVHAVYMYVYFSIFSKPYGVYVSVLCEFGHWGMREELVSH